MSTGVIYPAQPEQILKGLSKLWTQMGHEEKDHGQPTVLRACAMTLIVATDEADGGYTASQTISELMKDNPSRGIVLAVSESAEHELEARVLAQCWKPFGKAQQICCEEIEIKARPSSWPNVGPTLIGLVAADLPVIFWCRHSGALRPNATADEKAGLNAIAALSQKIIFDSKDIPTKDAIKLIDDWQKRRQVVADLAWTRLTPWREPLCHVFDNETRQTPFSKFQSIEIEHTEKTLPLSALYIGAWLSGPYGATVRFRQVEGYAPGLHRVVLRSDGETIELCKNGAECATLSSTNGPSRHYNFGGHSLTALLTEELALPGIDPVFNRAMSRVKELAEAN